MTLQKFKDYLFDKFLEWEKTTPKRRSSFSAYTRWLSDNSYKIEIKQQVFDTWINGSLPKDAKYIYILAEKLGNEVYELLNFPRPNPYLQKINRLWEFLPEDVQKKFSAEAEEYETKNISNRVSKTPKSGKVRKLK